MAMVGADLGAAMKAAVDAAVASTPSDRVAIFNALGTAIVDYITVNAEVTVASVSGVTVGAGVSGPGTGTVS